MGMQINTNLSALSAHRNLSNTQNDLSKSLEKLSSGLRINRAADDAAGLSIAEGLRSQVNGMAVAARNAQDGISVIQTAEGGLAETHSILQRMRDLAVQAGNDSNNNDSRTAIETEITALRDELSRIADSSNFSGTKLLDGTAGKMTFQVGADGDAGSQITLDLTNASVDDIVTKIAFGGSNVKENATVVSGDFAASLGKELRFTSGAVQVSVGSAELLAATDVQETVSALNKDAAFAANFTAEAVKIDTAGVITYDLKVTSKATTTADGTGPTDAAGPNNVIIAADLAADDVFVSPTQTVSETEVGLTDAAGAQEFLKAVDGAIATVSTARSELGAVQNRFDSAINTLNVSRENLQAAESRIRDVDMAAEMVNFTRSNILSQAGTAMLAQANQSNQGVLQLLG